MAVFARERARSLRGYITSPWLISSTSPSSLIAQARARERRDNPFAAIVLEISESLRRLRGRSVWSSAIVPLPSRDDRDLESYDG